MKSKPPTIYRGVRIQYDEDNDTRVLRVIDEIVDKYPDNLFYIAEHEGMVVLRWRKGAPKEYRNGFETPDGDYWVLYQDSTHCDHSTFVRTLKLVPTNRPDRKFYPTYIPQVQKRCFDCDQFIKFEKQTPELIEELNKKLAEVAI